MGNEYEVLGTVELTDVQEKLIRKYAHTILNGTVEQAIKAFYVIFEREPANDLELDIFRAICMDKEDKKQGILGIIRGGKDESSN